MSESDVEGFEARWREDRDAGRVRTLLEYLKEFPGDQMAVAQRYLELENIECSTLYSPNNEDLESGPAVVEEDLQSRYRVIRRLGSGGQGTVYLAEETTTLRRRVALKRLHGLDRPGTRELRLRFKQGARVLSRLSHVHICGILEANLDASVPYLVMSFVEGESLASKIASALEHHSPDTASCIDLQAATSTVCGEVGDGSAGEAVDPGSTPTVVRQERAALNEVIALIEQVARALHWAHERGVIHRDIKPGNIMVTPEGTGVLMDFDMARDDRPRTHELTRVGDAFGTPAYMAPEMLRDEERSFGRCGDIWSLGVTLYQCLTLRRPFSGTTRQGLFQAILTKDPTPLRVAQPAASRDLDLVIQKVLEKNPERRYATALEFAEDLKRIRCGEHPLARRANAMRRTARFFQRRPSVALASLLGIVVLGLGSALYSAIDVARTERNAANRARALVDQHLARASRTEGDLLVLQMLEGALNEMPQVPADMQGRLRGLQPMLDHIVAEASSAGGTPPARVACAQRLRIRIKDLLQASSVR